MAINGQCVYDRQIIRDLVNQTNISGTHIFKTLQIIQIAKTLHRRHAEVVTIETSISRLCGWPILSVAHTLSYKVNNGNQ